MDRSKEKSRCILRGGSWNNINMGYFHAHFRNRRDPVNRYYNRGFRCIIPCNKNWARELVRIK